MALNHAQPLQPIDIRPLGSALAGAQSVALFKSEQLEVMRLVLPAGKSLPPHQVAGEITVQCLEGRIVFDAQGERQLLDAGQLLYLPGGVMHGLQALQDASVLVTIVLRR